MHKGSRPALPGCPRGEEGGGGPLQRTQISLAAILTVRKPCSSVAGRMLPSTAITNSRPSALKQKPKK